jgi:Spy/CpxP family protein refolding chaperone
MKKPILAAAAIAILSTVSVMAQPSHEHGFDGPGPSSGSTGKAGAAPATDPATLAARQVTFLTQLLTLTTGQQTQATAYFTAAITANQALDTQETAAWTALVTAVKANNTANITTQANAIGSIEAQRTANTAKADAAFYALLTTDQQTKLDSINNDGFFGPGFGIHVPGGR